MKLTEEQKTEEIDSQAAKHMKSEGSVIFKAPNGTNRQ
jgi:hypothetical protein